MLKQPVRYRPDVETVGPHEQKTIDGLNDTFRTIVEKTNEDFGHAQRGVHAKSHALLEGEMVVRVNLSLAIGAVPHEAPKVPFLGTAWASVARLCRST